MRVKLFNRPFTREPYPQWYRNLPVVIFLPWRNLGCFGVKVGPIYADLYSRRWSSRLPWVPGIFVSVGGRGRWFYAGRRTYWITVRGVRRGI